MLRKGLLVIMALTLSVAVGRATDVSVFGSYWDTDELDDALGAGVRLRIGSGHPFWFELRGTYFDDLTEDEGAADVELQAIPVDAGIALGIVNEEEAAIYLAAGGTYTFLDVDPGDVDDELGWYVGVGGELRITSHLALFVDYLYRDVEATAENDDLDMITDDVAVDLAGSVLSVGVVFR